MSYKTQSIMKCSISQAEIKEVIESLNNGAKYSNEVAGWSYSKGQVMMKLTASGKMIIYPTIEKMARAIVKSIKTGE